MFLKLLMVFCSRQLTVNTRPGRSSRLVPPRAASAPRPGREPAQTPARCLAGNRARIRDWD